MVVLTRLHSLRILHKARQGRVYTAEEDVSLAGLTVAAPKSSFRCYLCSFHFLA
jgi:hypothetical protein